MPLFYQQTIDRHTKVGVWKIEENESFFLQTVPLQRSITHWHKRLQHLAGRYLLRYLFPDFPYELIRIADTRKPFLENEAYHFSISHCGDFAAAIVSSEKRVGVDAEIYSDKIDKVKNKFIHEVEWNVLDQFVPPEGQLRFMTMLWSCKEAIFKWYGNGLVDFKEHIQLQDLILNEQDPLIYSDFIFQKHEPVLLSLNSLLQDKFVLSWVLTTINEPCRLH